MNELPFLANNLLQHTYTRRLACDRECTDSGAQRARGVYLCSWRLADLVAKLEYT